MVNNSALGGYKPFEEWTLEQLQKVQEVNNWSAWLLAEHVLPGMRERKRGAILNISSRLGRDPARPAVPAHCAGTRAGSAYGSTKAMLDRWTASLAVETHGQGIQVTRSPATRCGDRVRIGGNAWFPDIYFEPLDTMAEAALASSPVTRHAHGPDRTQPRSARRARPSRLRPARRTSSRRLAAGRHPGDRRRAGRRRREARDEAQAKADAGRLLAASRAHDRGARRAGRVPAGRRRRRCRACPDCGPRPRCPRSRRGTRRAPGSPLPSRSRAVK